MDNTLYTVVARPAEARIFSEHLAAVLGDALNFLHPEDEFRPRNIGGRWLLRVIHHGHAKGWVGHPELPPTR